MANYETENNNIGKTLTLGNLFQQDFPCANFLPVYPSSFNDDAFRFVNKGEYRIFYIPESSDILKLFLVPLRNCCVAGNQLPILVPELPSEFLLVHWRKWCYLFVEPVIKTIDEGLQDDNVCIMLFPLEAISKQKHAVEPELHYHILKKSAVTEIGAPHPKYFNETNVEFPCMIKIDQSFGGYGNYVVQSREEFGEKLKLITERFGSDAFYVVSEYIQEVQSTIGCGFYVTKSGNIIYLGVQECAVKKDFQYHGGSIDWDMQDKYRERVYDKFVVPVAKYLHNKGYFGMVGIDIITSPRGDYLVDLNPRINASTSHLILASNMAKLGLTKSRYEVCATFDVTSEELVKKANSINEENLSSRIIIMTAVDEGDKCHAAFSVFCDSEEMVDSLCAKLRQY
ncbi:uncharacterized protein LOC114537722 [Dendronephthya gigantea]|uniref:uncharacterized protein LOC114537722 n=1 Tax=Dendronephthya gigantea TaxID=151771 RepID=UPI00106A88AA|nr:uncharacterized protein LOC114537722 [Dendronephthya gigantea]